MRRFLGFKGSTSTDTAVGASPPPAVIDEDEVGELARPRTLSTGSEYKAMEQVKKTLTQKTVSPSLFLAGISGIKGNYGQH